MYKIGFSRIAAEELRRIFKIERKLYFRIITAIEPLAQNPYLGKKLKGKFQDDYSLRVGDYRVIYSIQKDKLFICIIDVGHRREIYQ